MKEITIRLRVDKDTRDILDVQRGGLTISEYIRGLIMGASDRIVEEKDKKTKLKVGSKTRAPKRGLKELPSQEEEGFRSYFK